MAQAPKYERQADFSDDEARSVTGRSTVRTAALDAELDAIQATVNALRSNLALLQRDDGRLGDGVVEPHTLSTAIKALIGGGWNPRGAWQQSTSYAIKDFVEVNGYSYVCAVAHTSGTDFNADKASGYWLTVTIPQVLASGVSFSPTQTITAGDVQGAIQEIDDELRPIAAELAHQTYGGL